MNAKHILALIVVALACAFAPLLGTTQAGAGDPLPWWKDGKTKQAILDFVAKVTKEGSPDFVPPEERVATFDQAARSGANSRSCNWSSSRPGSTRWSNRSRSCATTRPSRPPSQATWPT